MQCFVPVLVFGPGTDTQPIETVNQTDEKTGIDTHLIETRKQLKLKTNLQSAISSNQV